jgi:ATP-dependent RNA helicase DeaD
MHERGYKIDTLHGDKNQDARERSMRAFREHKVRLLICTDVAARGLDVKDITHVINYSLPRELDNYVHRIGRTARSGKAGIAMSLVTPSHRDLVRRIEQKTKSRMTEGRIPSRRDIGLKKIAALLAKFNAQEDKFARAVELLNEDWKIALMAMDADEVAGRFLAMMIPDVFQSDERPMMKRTAPPAATTAAPARPVEKRAGKPFYERVHRGSGDRPTKVKPRHFRGRPRPARSAQGDQPPRKPTARP